ncbi:MAG: undecaprenyldiphospho-muramoylpentapeptide beta-N-acetylglucosaminyltransferase [Candidatus Marinimicrobia bacterium]|nr:undecaprenyldiphospho-muramoylpentapeptide beta-N-acetylglucosaminyltransferase [Candidatus Neomarinimicrobiota bacterium]|tara:strand:+ start:4348 stop:5460 length:1113 start_codon:yes stop_codon:yes gene_type:complete
MDSKKHLNNKGIIIAGGGTGGHLFPALTIGAKLSEVGADVFYMGSKFGIEASLFKNKNLSYLLLNIRGIQRGLDLKSIGKNFLFPYRFIYSMLKAFMKIKRFKPSIVIGTGGYSSAIPLFCAKFLKIPIILHEQNSYPGITTRFFAKNAKVVCVANEKTKNYIESRNIKITGNPIRSSIRKINQSEAQNKMNLGTDKFTIFFFGGSQGSKPINDFLVRNYKFFLKLGCQLIWQCGQNSYEKIIKQVNHPDVHIKSFINQMDIAYSAASLVVCRSGAISIAELTAFGKAMILIPFPQAAGNHQEYNARVLEEKKAAIVILQKELNKGILQKTVKELVNSKNKIIEYEIQAKKNEIKNSTEKILKQIIEVAA